MHVCICMHEANVQWPFLCEALAHVPSCTHITHTERERERERGREREANRHTSTHTLASL